MIFIDVYGESAHFKSHFQNSSKQLELGMMTAQIKALEAGANKDNADANNKEQDTLKKEQEMLKLGEEITEVKERIKHIVGMM